MNQITIHFFGQLTDIAGCDCVQMTGVENTDALLDKLLGQYPGLRTISFLLAVDKKIIRNKTSIHADAEIALLPPFSGG